MWLHFRTGRAGRQRCWPQAMMANAILDRNPRASEADVRLGLSGNLCRCGTHNRIVRAILKAAQTMGRS